MRFRSAVAAALLFPSTALAAPASLEFIGVGVGSAATQIAVRLSRDASYTVKALPAADDRPHRLYVDFTDTKLAPGAGSERPVSTGAVRQVRTGQFTTSTARVVLDLRGHTAYRVETQRNPFRLVIHLENPTTAVAQEPAAPPREQQKLDAPAPSNLSPAPPADTAIAKAPTTVAEPKVAMAPKVTTAASQPPAPAANAAPAIAAPSPSHAETAAAEKTPAQDAPAEKAAAETPAVAPPVDAAPVPVPDAPVAVAKATGTEVDGGVPTSAPETREYASRASGAPLAFVDAPPAAGNEKLAKIPSVPIFPDRVRVVIDPGHGGRDPGAQSIDGTWEKNIVLEVARELARRTRKRLDVDVVLTRTGDETVSIDERAAYASGQDSLFVSVHGNACPESWVQGVQTFYPEGGNFGPQSRRLARLVHHRIVAAIDQGYGPVRDGGVRARDLAVLERSKAPSLLVEAAYLSNPSDRRRLDDASYRSALVDGIVDGIADYLSGVPEPTRLLARRDG
jgi:N-acetylmuramoyl-L-alanine amidase